MGGPFRGMIQAMTPREVDWSPVPVPFAGLPNYFRNRLNPGVSTAWDLIDGRDFYGGDIYKGAGPMQVLRGFMYGMEGVMPLTAGALVSGIRRGLDPAEIAEEAGGQFAGSNLGRESVFQARDNNVYRWATERGYVTLATMGDGTKPGQTPRSYWEMQSGHQKIYDQLFPEEVESIKSETKRRADQGIDSAQRTQRSEDLKEEYKEYQEKDDAGLRRYWAGDLGGMNAESWRESRRRRGDELRGRREELYVGVDTKDPKTIIDFYFAKMDELAVKHNARMTPEAWEELDIWSSQQSDDDQIAIEENTRLTGMTAVVQQYYDDLKALQPYWDIEDDMLASLATAWQMRWADYRAADRPLQAMMQSSVKPIQDRLSLLHRQYRMTHPEIDKKLTRWGYSGKPKTPEAMQGLLNQMFGSPAQGQPPQGPAAPRGRVPLPRTAGAAPAVAAPGASRFAGLGDPARLRQLVETGR